ncbi:MAG: A/G-specific adenine glycosylase, partial [Alistipes sp.]|nr:A/G-specific adenine glycosylase [Alistipes sp.]
METITAKLCDWYEAGHRELPWRETKDPYRIWISEVILQQTRVAQGLDYYHRFLERFPSVQALATASEDEVLKAWQGLGYYSRARNLHAAAQQIVQQHGGVFPETYAAVRALQGVGEYTAAAICAFAFDQPYVAIDGNVQRVVSRLFDLESSMQEVAGRKQLRVLADTLLDRRRPALFNQALMEFGALQCHPKGAECRRCPLMESCLAFGHDTVVQRPVKGRAVRVRPRYFNYFYVRCGTQVLLHRRAGHDIWRNLYEFPLIETEEATSWEALWQSECGQRWFHDLSSFRIEQ